MTNKKVLELAEINDISCEVRRKSWNWLGHILRREGENDCCTMLRWTPEGRRARRRPTTTWRRAVEKKRNKAGWKSWEVPKGLHKIESIGQTTWRPYASTVMMRLDDDQCLEG